MFDASGFCHIASNARNRQKWSVFVYKTNDTESQMLAAGYFNAKATELNLHDMILALREQPNSGRWIYSTFIVTQKTTDTITVSGTIMSAWVEANLLNKTDRNSDFMTPVDSNNKGATMTEINALVEQLAGVQIDLTEMIDTKATKATDFVTPLTSTNKGLTQAEQQVLEEKIDTAATSGKIIASYWFGKTEEGDVPAPTESKQNYFDFLTQTPYTALADLSGWAEGEPIVLPSDEDVQILITSKFWNIPEQAGQQGGKAYWSHTAQDWSYYPTIISFASPALSGVPTTPNLTEDSPSAQVANKQYVDSAIVSGVFAALYPVGAIYITTSDTNPMATLIPGSKWSLVASGRALWGVAAATTAGSNLSAGLPNIKGTLYSGGVQVSVDYDGGPVNVPTSGAFRGTAAPLVQTGGKSGGGRWCGYMDNANFDASRSNSIYGNSTTVQPPAYTVHVFRRTA